MSTDLVMLHDALNPEYTLTVYHGTGGLCLYAANGGGLEGASIKVWLNGDAVQQLQAALGVALLLMGADA